MPEPSAVDQLADGFWERFKQLNPISATINGDARYDDKLPDPSPAGRAADRRLAEDMRDQAAAIPDEGLSVEDRITRDVLRVIGEIFVVQDDQRIDTLQVVDQMGGPQTLLPQLCQFQTADTPERLELFLARLHAYPKYMADNRELLREALASGLTAPRIVAVRTIAQLERMLAIPIDEAVVPSLVQVARDEDREAIRDVVRDEVYPADAAFLEALRGEYLAASREENGIWSAPDGDALYRTQILRWTTLDLDPAEVHRIGLDELETIEAERRTIARAAGFGDDTAAYRASLADDPANQAPSREALDRARHRGHRARQRARAPDVPPAPGLAVPGHPGRGVQGARRAVRLLLPAVGGHDPAGHVLRQHVRPARRASTRAWRPRPTTRPSRATTSRSRSRARTPR